MSHVLTVKNANIEFNQQGTPVASDFDDVYFSNQDGLQETTYVFLHNNQIPQRWLEFDEKQFVIAETGFGTGLNFLATWRAFRTFTQHHPQAKLSRLHFISVEKFPLTAKDLSAALAIWPDLADLATALCEQYPLPLAGCHRLSFDDGAITLDLWFGDLHDVLPQWTTTKQGQIDAWYLDGFAPSKNPDMWSDQLFQHMARLAKNNGTFATFTAAGFVKRGLKAAGFCVEKRKGYGRKRDMLAGHITLNQADRPVQHVYYRNTAELSSAQPVAIIGAGMAGANCAYALAQRGIACDVFCQEPHAAGGASGNPQGGFYPMLNAEPNLASRVQASAFLFAARQYRSLLDQGWHFGHQWCGVLQLAFNEKVAHRQHNLLDKGHWPEQLIQFFSETQSREVAGIELPYSGLFIPLGGWICPPELVNALLTAANKRAQTKLYTERQLVAINRIDEKWKLDFADGSSHIASTVVLANGHALSTLNFGDQFPARLVRGQVEAIPSQPPLEKLQTVLCHKGYLTPAKDGSHALGSTYIKQDTCTDYRTSEQTQNLDTHKQALAKCDWVDQIEGHQQGRAAIRCGMPDHQPLVGAVPDAERQKREFADLYKALPDHHYPIAGDQPNLFVLSGLGSRGLTTAPLMAEILAAQMCNESLPLERDLLNALNPNRFMIRQLIRREQ